MTGKLADSMDIKRYLSFILLLSKSNNIIKNAEPTTNLTNNARYTLVNRS